MFLIEAIPLFDQSVLQHQKEFNYRRLLTQDYILSVILDHSKVCGWTRCKVWLSIQSNFSKAYRSSNMQMNVLLLRWQQQYQPVKTPKRDHMRFSELPGHRNWYLPLLQFANLDTALTVRTVENIFKPPFSHWEGACCHLL